MIDDPTTITGCELWLDAADNSKVLKDGSNPASDGDTVRWVQDKSGNGRSFGHSNVIYRPYYNINSPKNGRNTVVFEKRGSDTAWKTISLESQSWFKRTNASTYWNIYVAINDVVLADHASLYRIFNYRDSGFLVTMHGSTTISANVNGGTAATISYDLKNGGGYVLSYHIYPNNNTLFVNGILTATGANSTNITANGGFWIFGNKTTNQFVKGHFCELLMYTGDHLGTNIDRKLAIERYLSDKWAIR